jgi:hypothetical protein
LRKIDPSQKGNYIENSHTVLSENGFRYVMNPTVYLIIVSTLQDHYLTYKNSHYEKPLEV